MLSRASPSLLLRFTSGCCWTEGLRALLAVTVGGPFSSLSPESFHKAAQNMTADFSQVRRARGCGSKMKKHGLLSPNLRSNTSSCLTLFIRTESLSPVLTEGGVIQWYD